ncbi:MAG: calcium/sodium antiporter [Gammaproteobacteria bacterium]|nr:calcium/sodium antiporter [Gammaproteobacteria bacterium]
MLYDILAILVGFSLLIWSADLFVNGASAVARNLGISPLLIGLVIVGFGTSAPEMLVAVFASVDGSPGLAIGNALGSNITNIALVLGVTALIVPLHVHSGIIKREMPILTGIMLIVLLMFLDQSLSRIDGIILLLGLFVVMGWLSKQAMKETADPMSQEFADELPAAMSTAKASLLLTSGLLVLLGSSKLLVWGASNIAIELGVSDLIIGLTIVAIGTSLPELAATIMSAYKKEHDIALGNIIGSNIFNMLGVMAFPALIAPGALPQGVLERDLPWTIGLTLLLFIFAYGFKSAGYLSRFKGGIFLICFIAYETVLYLSATAA